MPRYFNTVLRDARTLKVMQAFGVLGRSTRRARLQFQFTSKSMRVFTVWYEDRKTNNA